MFCECFQPVAIHGLRCGWLLGVLVAICTDIGMATESQPLAGRWRPDDDSRQAVQLAQGLTAEADDTGVLMIFARSKGSVRTDLLPVPVADSKVSFTYQTAGGVARAQVIVQGLNRSFGTTDYLTFDLPASSQPRAFDRSIRLSDKAAHTILRFRVEGEGTLRIEGLLYNGRAVVSSIVSGRLGVGPTIVASSDAKPVGTLKVSLTEPTPLTWKQVFIGGAGTVRTIKVHPADGTVVAGADVSGPFYWDVPWTIPAGATRTIPKYPHLTWEMHDRGWRATLDAFGREHQGLVHTDQIAFDPSDPQRLYYVGGQQWLPGRGVLVTQDRGRTWTFAALTRPDGKPVFINNASTGERLKVDPSDPITIYYGSRRDGLYRSGDRGVTWRHVDSFPAPFTQYGVAWVQFATRDGKPVTIAAAHPSNKQSPFESAIYLSTDAGQTWNKTDWPYAPLGMVDPQGRFLYTSSKQVMKTELATGVWTDITPMKLGPGQNPGWDYSPVAVSYEDPDRLVVFTREYAEGCFFRSRDGGTTWEKFHNQDSKTGGANSRVVFLCAPYYPTTGGGENLFNGVWDVAFDSIKRDRLWIGFWPGVLMCDDAWAERPVFRTMIEGHEEVCLFDLISLPRGAPLVSGMMDVGGFVHDRLDVPPLSAMVGVAPEGPHGQYAPLEVTSLDFCESDPDFIAAAVCWRYTPPPDGNGTGHARYSKDGGKTWQRFPAVPFPGAKDGRIAVAAANPRNLVWMPRGDANSRVAFTRDQGQTWQQAKGAPVGLIWPDLVFTFYKPLAADRVQDGWFYIYDKRDGRFFRSEDGGENWRHISRLPAQGDSHTAYHRVAAVPGQAGGVWCALENKGLFRSEDAGASWTQLNGVEHAVDVSFGPSLAEDGPAAVYIVGRIDEEVQTGLAVYRSDNQGRSWTRLDDASLGWASVTALAADRQTPGRVFVGTNGRGIFFAALPTTE